MKNIFKLVLGFIIFTTIVSSFLLVKNKAKNAPPIEEVYQPFCGTNIGMDQSEDAQKGKQIFNANCAACHKLDAVSTGPALRDIATKYREHNMELLNYLQGKRDRLVLRHPNKSGMGLCPVFPNLTKEEVASLKAYTH